MGTERWCVGVRLLDQLEWLQMIQSIGFVCNNRPDSLCHHSGNNNYGQLGLGTNTAMFTVTDVADLGTGFFAHKLLVYEQGNCALDRNQSIAKCWGYNGMNTCDQSADGKRGDAADEMGDFLLPIDFGSGFVPHDFAYGTVSYQVCAVAANNDIKCWGANWYLFVVPSFCVIVRMNADMFRYGCPSSTTLWGDDMMYFETGFADIADFCVGWGTQCAASRFVAVR